jgi:hypothetical protein
MENPVYDEGRLKKELEAKLFYHRIGRVWCPVLDEFIIFGREGFQHLVRKHGVPRPRKDQQRRIFLLPQAKLVIEDPRAKILQRKQELSRAVRFGEKEVVVPPADFWMLARNLDDRTITVVIRQFKGKPKNFFSVYDKKQKPAQGADL